MLRTVDVTIISQPVIPICLSKISLLYKYVIFYIICYIKSQNFYKTKAFERFFMEMGKNIGSKTDSVYTRAHACKFLYIRWTHLELHLLTFSWDFFTFIVVKGKFLGIKHGTFSLFLHIQSSTFYHFLSSQSS